MTDIAYDFRRTGVVITGGASGIGRALVEAFAHAGASVVAADKDDGGVGALADELQKSDATVISQACDVTSETDVETLATRALEVLDHVDVLVNSAGIVCDKIPITNIDADAWHQIFSVNVFGSFLTLKHFGRIFASQKSGAVVNMGSIAGKIPRWKMAPYSASKAALLQLTKVFAIEMAEHNVRANLVCPGATNTPLMQYSTSRDNEASTAYRVRGSPERFRAPIPLRRIAEPEDQVGMTLFLASSYARHITGQAIYIDGGESTI